MTDLKSAIEREISDPAHVSQLLEISVEKCRDQEAEKEMNKISGEEDVVINYLELAKFLDLKARDDE